MSVLLYCLAYLTAFAGFTAVATVVDAWALKTLWGWFVVPLFGLPALSLWMAAGLSLAYLALRGYVPQGMDEKKDAAEKMGHFFTIAILRPAFLVCVGYVVHLLAVGP